MSKQHSNEGLQFRGYKYHKKTMTMKDSLSTILKRNIELGFVESKKIIHLKTSNYKD